VIRKIGILVALAVWSSATALVAVAQPAPVPSPRPSDASLGGQPDVQFHADVRADSLRYQTVPKRAGATITGVNVRGKTSTVTNVPSPKPGITYRNVHAVYDASARFVDPHASPVASPARP